MPPQFFSNWSERFVESGLDVLPLKDERIINQLKYPQSYYRICEEKDTAILHHFDGDVLSDGDDANLHIEANSGPHRPGYVESLCHLLLAESGIQLLYDDEEVTRCRRLFRIESSLVRDVATTASVQEFGLEFNRVVPGPLLGFVAYGHSRRLGKQLTFCCRNFPEHSCLLGFNFYLDVADEAHREVDLAIELVGRSRCIEIEPQVECDLPQLD